MPRAELPAIIPLRQFGKDTWLAPGFIEAGRRRARVIRAQRRNRDGARRSLRAGGRKACRRLSRHGECGAQLRAPAQRAADDGAAVCFHSSGGILGLGDRLGKLATGYRADMVALDGAAIAVLDTWVAGAGGER
jgi:hypothetical protein